MPKLLNAGMWSFLGLYYFLEMPTIVHKPIEPRFGTQLIDADEFDAYNELFVGTGIAERGGQMLVLRHFLLDYVIAVPNT